MREVFAILGAVGLLAGCVSNKFSRMTASVNGTPVVIGSGVDRLVSGEPDRSLQVARTDDVSILPETQNQLEQSPPDTGGAVGTGTGTAIGTETGTATGTGVGTGVVTAPGTTGITGPGTTAPRTGAGGATGPAAPGTRFGPSGAGSTGYGFGSSAGSGVGR